MSSNENEMSKDDEAFEKEMKGFGRRRCWKFPFFIAAIILVKSGLVMLIWNALIPDLFHGPVVTYLQAMGLVVLAKLLVGFHGRPHFGGHHHHHGPGFGRHRWGRLSREEREKLREHMRTHHGVDRG